MVQHFAKMILHIQLKKFKVVFFFFKPAYKTFWHQRIFCCFSNGKLPRIVMDLKKKNHDFFFFKWGFIYQMVRNFRKRTSDK